MEPKFDGVTVKVGGVEYVIPPLNLRQIRRFQADLETMGEKNTLEILDIASKILHSALSRNYPEMTPEQCEEMLDVQNVGIIMQAITGQSGLANAGGATAGSGQTGMQSTLT